MNFVFRFTHLCEKKSVPDSNGFGQYVQYKERVSRF